MDTSSIGAYTNIQALNLISRLGSTSSGSSSDDLISLLGNQSDTLSLSSVSQWLSRTQEYNPFKADFESLGDLISSGDLSAAQAAYAAMQEKMQAAGSEDPMASDFAAIGTALESGDATAAQEAWTALDSKLQSMGAPPPPPPEEEEESSSSGTSYSTTDIEALLASMYWQSSYFTNSSST